MKKLQHIGSEGKPAASAWDKRFAVLRRFVKEHGHASGPREVADDPALGTWVNTQRRANAAELERKAGREPSCTVRISAARVKIYCVECCKNELLYTW